MILKLSLSFLIFLTNLIVSAEHKLTEEMKKNSSQGTKIYKSRETSEGKSVILKWIETNENGLRKMVQETENGIETSYGNNSTTRWTYQSKTSSDSVEVLIKDNIGTIYVTKNAVASSKSFNLNKEPFKYPPSFSMNDFINSDKKSLIIWVSNKADGELRQMVFTKLMNETITIEGNTYECLKMEMKPTGFSGMFWQAYYWFEIKTGKFIKYFGKKGPPGTPDFTIEAIK